MLLLGVDGECAGRAAHALEHLELVQMRRVRIPRDVQTYLMYTSDASLVAFLTSPVALRQQPALSVSWVFTWKTTIILPLYAVIYRRKILRCNRVMLVGQLDYIMSRFG